MSKENKRYSNNYSNNGNNSRRFDDARRNHFTERRNNPQAVPLLKGSCIWFAKNNWSDKGDRPIRKCRNGSFCRYLHLTGEECQYIVDHYNDTEECIDCKFKYLKSDNENEEKKEEKREIITNIPEGNRPRIFDDINNKELWDKIRREMPCFTCRDSRKMLSKRKFNKIASKRNWCDCPQEVRFNSSTQHYPENSHPSGERDAWVCSNCNCICQVG